MNLFLSYNRNDEPVVRAIRDALESRGVRTFFDQANLPVGSAWIPALEQGIEGAGAVAVLLGPAGLGPWQKRELWLALERQARLERAGQKFPVVPVLLPQATPDVAAGLIGLMSWVDLRKGPGDAEAMERLAAVVGSRAAPAAAPAVPVEVPNPYRALDVFREEDRDLFFGRGEFTRALLQRIDSKPFVTVVGSSGSGKSSVVRAGVFPVLRARKPPAKTWEIAVVTPGKHPFRSLAAELLGFWETDGTELINEAGPFAEHLRADDGHLEDAVRSALERSSRADRLLLVVDQLEEVFTLVGDDERAAYLKRLVELPAGAPATVLLTLRADYYGRAISASRVLSDAIGDGLVNIGPMKREELQEAIEWPAKRVGVEFEPNLVPRILDHLDEQPGSLPLLQFTLSELWANRKQGAITDASYRAIGELKGSIATRAEAVRNALSAPRKVIADRHLTRLVRVSAAAEEGTDTRQRIGLSELLPAGSAEVKDLGQLPPDLRETIQEFVDARLLVLGAHPATAEVTLEVAHEVLLRSWPHLARIIDEDRAFLLWRQHHALLAKEWIRRGRPEDALLRGAALDEALAFARTRAGELNVELELLEASEAFRARELRLGARLRWRGVAVAGLAAAALVAWLGWTRTEGYQLERVLDDGASLAASIGADSSGVVNRWIESLVDAGEVERAAKGARRISNSEQRSHHLLHAALVAAERGDTTNVFSLFVEAASTELDQELLKERGRSLAMDQAGLEQALRAPDGLIAGKAALWIACSVGASDKADRLVTFGLWLLERNPVFTWNASTDVLLGCPRLPPASWARLYRAAIATAGAAEELNGKLKAEESILLKLAVAAMRGGSPQEARNGLSTYVQSRPGSWGSYEEERVELLAQAIANENPELARSLADVVSTPSLSGSNGVRKLSAAMAAGYSRSHRSELARALVGQLRCPAKALAAMRSATVSSGKADVELALQLQEECAGSRAPLSSTDINLFAGALLRAGQAKAALTLAGTAPRYVMDTVSDDDSRVTRMIKRLGGVGGFVCDTLKSDPGAAMALFEQIPRSDPGTTLCVATALLRAGDYERARQLFAPLDAAFKQKAQEGTGNFGEFFELSSTSSEFVALLIRDGHLSEVDVSHWLVDLSGVASILVGLGEVEKAIALMNGQISGGRAVDLVALGVALAKRGEVSQASAIETKLSFPEERSTVCSAIAIHLAEGDLHAAREKALTCERPTDRLAAYTAIVQSQSRRANGLDGGRRPAN